MIRWMAACGTTWAWLSAAQAASLTVTVDAVRNDTGRVFLCVFPEAAGFPDCGANPEPGVAHASQPSRAPSTVFRIDGLSPGTYAASSFHDEAGSGRVATGLFGIPRSGVGVSRDARGRFGPPRFADAAFQLGAQGGAIHMTMVYP